MSADEEQDGGSELSPREVEVVKLLVAGLSNREIACELDVSARTIQAHLANAMRKTLTRSRVQLAVYALRNGIAPLRAGDDD